VTGDRLGGRRLAEHQVSDECTHCDSKHNPTVVRHEKQHDEERVEDLYSIQDGLDNLHLLHGATSNATVSPWAK
jgi:hypothetical protein